MKSTDDLFRVTGFVIALVIAASAQAQTCVVGTQVSNPTSVYAIDTGSGTVTDVRTGLMWDRCSLGQAGAACTGMLLTFSWQGALDVAATRNGATYKGYTDWRLPNVKELMSLAEHCRQAPSINEFAFPGTAPSIAYWSSSPNALTFSTSAWSIFFGGGAANADPRATLNNVRLVRSGQ